MADRVARYLHYSVGYTVGAHAAGWTISHGAGMAALIFTTIFALEAVWSLAIRRFRIVRRG